MGAPAKGVLIRNDQVHQRTSKTPKWNSNPENTQKWPISPFSGIFVGDVWAQEAVPARVFGRSTGFFGRFPSLLAFDGSPAGAIRDRRREVPPLP